MSEASKVLFAAAMLIAVNDAINVYCIMNDTEKHVGRVIVRCIVLCTILVSLAIILE